MYMLYLSKYAVIELVFIVLQNIKNILYTRCLLIIFLHIYLLYLFWLKRIKKTTMLMDANRNKYSVIAMKIKLSRKIIEKDLGTLKQSCL